MGDLVASWFLTGGKHTIGFLHQPARGLGGRAEPCYRSVVPVVCREGARASTHSPCREGSPCMSARGTRGPSLLAEHGARETGPLVSCQSFEAVASLVERIINPDTGSTNNCPNWARP